LYIFSLTSHNIGESLLERLHKKKIKENEGGGIHFPFFFSFRFFSGFRLNKAPKENELHLKKMGAKKAKAKTKKKKERKRRGSKGKNVCIIHTLLFFAFFLFFSLFSFWKMWGAYDGE
jgi:hypothetical protein